MERRPRLARVDLPDGAVWTYTYDPLGRRTTKTRHAPDGTAIEQTRFAWDGPLLAETIRTHAGDGTVEHLASARSTSLYCAGSWASP